ncbi:MAG: GNAT family N-acetyltransferase [Chloroflexi bacterium]|nr:GNAT family N-acetyltransferase [Chloroflexota bacterium]
MPVEIRAFRPADLHTILEIAVAAWRPIFASFREIIGDELFDLTTPDPDDKKRQQVTRACQDDSPTIVWVAEFDDEIAGFITVDMNHETLVAEIGNNAVSPNHQHRGIGTQMYEFVLDYMRQSGMKYAIVETGGDESHAPARRAYEKVGFAGAVPSVVYHLKL